jgi:hypothetical protein
MAKTKITTISYFLKRLRDSGYVADKLYTDYSISDSRSWTVVVDPANASIMVTCFNNRNFLGEEYFEIYDGSQYVPDNFKIKTSSIEVVIEYLVKFNINNKSGSYKGN